MTDPQLTGTVQSFNQAVIQEFRANGGTVGGSFEGAPMTLLTTTGARSGTWHTTPLVYLDDGDRILVFASNAGAASHPAWYHNILANPTVTVEVGTRTSTATAVEVRGEAHDRLYARQSERIPAYARYQTMTSRVIPVVALYPTGAEPSAKADLASDGQPDTVRAHALGDELVRIHNTLRGELAAARSAVNELISGRAEPGSTRPTLSLGPELRSHCLTFCESLHAHHTTEDGAFPRIERQFPELGPALHKFRQEHRMVARILQDLRTLLTGSGAGSGDAETVGAELDRLASELETHFDDEERQLLGALNALRGSPGG